MMALEYPANHRDWQLPCLQMSIIAMITDGCQRETAVYIDRLNNKVI